MTDATDQRPSPPLSANELAAAAKWPTPALANAVEKFNIQSRATGSISSDIAGRPPEYRDPNDKPRDRDGRRHP